jgi:hypothetical protein
MIDSVPKTRAALLDLIDQALFELDELKASVEFDEIEEFAPHMATYDALGNELTKLRAEAGAEGPVGGAGEDHPLMALARDRERVIPFHRLLKDINEAYKAGVS